MNTAFITAATIYLTNVMYSFHWAWMDIKCRYRRSMIGPLWETINMLVLILGISFVAGAIFNNNIVDMIGYIGLGIIVWNAILTSVNEGTACFIFYKKLIKNSTLGIGVYVGRTVFRICITSAHHFILYALALIFLPIHIGIEALLVIPGLLLLFVNMLWVVPALGLICARFRDLEMIIRNLMQMVFFVTPIFWDVRIISTERQFMVDYNPFYYFIEVVRAPLLGQVPAMSHYIVLLGITVAGYMLLWVLHRKMRPYLAFYV